MVQSRHCSRVLVSVAIVDNPWGAFWFSNFHLLWAFKNMVASFTQGFSLPPIMVIMLSN